MILNDYRSTKVSNKKHFDMKQLKQLPIQGQHNAPIRDKNTLLMDNLYLRRFQVPKQVQEENLFPIPTCSVSTLKNPYVQNLLYAMKIVPFLLGYDFIKPQLRFQK